MSPRLTSQSKRPKLGVMTSPIDLERIEDATGGDKEFLQELVEIYLDDTDLRVKELTEELNKPDAEAFGRTAHKVKGSSANMGAIGLMDLAHKLEQMGKGGELSEAAATLKALTEEYERVKLALKELAQ